MHRRRGHRGQQPHREDRHEDRDAGEPARSPVAGVGAGEQSPHPAVDARCCGKGHRRHADRPHGGPVSDCYQAAGEADSVAGAGRGPFIREVLGDLLEPEAGDAIQGLREEDCFAESVEQLPGRVAASHVGQLVGEKAALVLLRELVDALGAADFGPGDPADEGNGDGRRGAAADGTTETHGRGDPLEQRPRRARRSRGQQRSQLEHRPAESDGGSHRPRDPQNEKGDGPAAPRAEGGRGGRVGAGSLPGDM